MPHTPGCEKNLVLSQPAVQTLQFFNFFCISPQVFLPCFFFWENCPQAICSFFEDFSPSVLLFVIFLFRYSRISALCKGVFIVCVCFFLHCAQFRLHVCTSRFPLPPKEVHAGEAAGAGGGGRGVRGRRGAAAGVPRAGFFFNLLEVENFFF